jgi:class 3 adenylate cyclase/tetratricopeptide (TPR) repeat protein
MADCPRCRAGNPEGYRFCGTCGAPLAVQPCPSCASANPVGQPFCGSCGAALDASAATGAVAGPAEPSVEERKLATVLFADVVGFTSLAERTDPEVVARMVDGAFQELGRVVAEHGGTVDKYMGDSVMAVFGVPVAHDDDAERAVSAGLAMRRLGGDLVFSIGINSGEVMVSALGRGDVTVIGDTVNVAARLEKAAGPGEVLCGRLTAELAGQRVAFEERQPVLLKGKREPVEVWAALRMRRAVDGPASARPPLVGRQEELAFLEMQWRRVREDRLGSLVVVCGDAGSGKSRLLDELAEMVGEEALVVRGAYPAYGAMGGLQLAAELIDQLGPSADPEVEMRVRSVVGDTDPALAGIDPAGMEHEQVWGIGRLIKERATDRPLVVVVDDLHAGDDRTLELLGHLAVQLRDLPLLTVVAGRTEPGGWLGRFSAATTLRLRALTRAESESLAEVLVGGRLEDEARRFFIDMAKGNPLYLRELVAVARDRGVLVGGDGGFRLTAERTVPASLRALLAARLDALDRAQKTVFQHLAVLGEASPAELSELGGREAGAPLAALVDSGLVRIGPDGRHEPADPLLGEVAYDMLPRTTRAELHRRAAELVGREEARGRHLERAIEYVGDDVALAAAAAEALAAEGRKLIDAFRVLDAVTMLERSVALGMRRPDVLIELGKLQGACGKEEEALATLALVPDDPDNPAQAIERDHSAAAAKLFVDPGWALPRLLEVAERWNRIGDKEKEAWALANAGVAHFYLSEMGPSAELCERGLLLFESIGDRSGVASASSFLSLARPEDPRVDRWLAEALAYADETGDRARQTTALATLAWRHFFMALGGTATESAVADDYTARLAAVAEEMGIVDMAVHGHSLRAVLARMSGRYEVARAESTALARLSDPAGHRNESWLAWAAGFNVAMATGSVDAAPPFPPEDTADPVLAMAGTIVEAGLILGGRFDEAVARRYHDHPLLQGHLADLGALYSALGLVLADRGPEATPLLERVVAAARLLGASPAERAARALLAELAGAAPDVEPVSQEPSLADALVLRARARQGAAEAGALEKVAEALCAPGLLVGLG